ncbi:unnamed protein product [Ostreobium quekettii]|uniref:Uncharacterized protein n=1 Tax=Ostreobium quekettii TaxID=121088 RepID=A0A8S1ISH8_9CHLO|nr:unnamed protein product [Ostreobium quekettii]|eukprot:evm.model.scf_985EXC.4 EVM.evm.TU.scf_985EXC.4   scf_985EXC:29422-30294(-)
MQPAGAQPPQPSGSPPGDEPAQRGTDAQGFAQLVEGASDVRVDMARLSALMGCLDERLQRRKRRAQEEAVAGMAKVRADAGGGRHARARRRAEGLIRGVREAQAEVDNLSAEKVGPGGLGFRDATVGTVFRYFGERGGGAQGRGRGEWCVGRKGRQGGHSGAVRRPCVSMRPAGGPFVLVVRLGMGAQPAAGFALVSEVLCGFGSQYGVGRRRAASELPRVVKRGRDRRSKLSIHGSAPLQSPLLFCWILLLVHALSGVATRGQERLLRCIAPSSLATSLTLSTQGLNGQ